MVLLVSHWLAKDALCDSQLVDEAEFISRSVMHGRGKRGLLSAILAWRMQTWLLLCSFLGLLLRFVSAPGCAMHGWVQASFFLSKFY